MRRLLGCVAAALVFSLGLAARADDEKVPLDKVPGKIKKAVKAKYPKAKMVSCAKGDNDGTKVFEFQLKQGKKTWEASFTPDGKFFSAEEEIKEADLPAKVKAAFNKKYPKAKVVKMEKETKGEGDSAKVVYEIFIKRGKGQVEVQFDPTGKFLGEEKVKEKKKE